MIEVLNSLLHEKEAPLPLIVFFAAARNSAGKSVMLLKADTVGIAVRGADGKIAMWPWHTIEGIHVPPEEAAAYTG